MSRKDRIKQELNLGITPLFLSVEDESGNHAVPKGSQTHFKVVAVSTLFSALNRIERHRLVHHLLHKEFETGLHALSLHLYTAEEWAKQSVPHSPICKNASPYPG